MGLSPAASHAASARPTDGRGVDRGRGPATEDEAVVAGLELALEHGVARHRRDRHRPERGTRLSLDLSLDVVPAALYADDACGEVHVAAVECAQLSPTEA